MVNQGTSNRLFSKSVIFLLVMLVFPPAWDALSDMADNTSLWIVNPLYTFDDEEPCPDTFYGDIDGLWTYEYITSPYILWGDKQTINPNQEDLRRTPPNLNQRIDTMERLCKPELRVNYVFGQMLRNTEVNQLRDEFGFPSLNATDPLDSAWMDARSGDILSGATGAFTNLMLGLTKALVAIQVLILTVLIGVMTDLLVHMVIAALPVFLVLSVLPYCDRIVGKFIEAVPALLLLPMMTAVIVSVGAAGIAEAPSSADGSPYTNPDKWASAENTEQSADPYDHVYTWITALGVVFFAITLPTILVPWIGSSLHMAQWVVSSAVQASSLIAGSAATGAASGMAQARAGGGRWGSILRGGMMGAASTGMHAMGSAGMPMGRLGPGPGEIARGATAAQAASQAGAASAQAAAQKFDRMLEAEAGKDVSPRDALAVQQAGPTGPNGESKLPGWDQQLSAERNGMRLHNALFSPGGAGHGITTDITTGANTDKIGTNTLDGWANIAGDTRAKLGNPELSTSGLDAIVNEQAASSGPNANKGAIKDRAIDHAMEMRGLKPDNPAHKAAFMSDLAANDAAVQARGGANYPHDKWWNDESNGGRHHTGSWEATNDILPKSKAGGAAGGGGPAAGGAQGGQGGWQAKPVTEAKVGKANLDELSRIAATFES